MQILKNINEKLNMYDIFKLSKEEFEFLEDLLNNLMVFNILKNMKNDKCLDLMVLLVIFKNFFGEIQVFLV